MMTVENMLMAHIVDGENGKASVTAFLRELIQEANRATVENESVAGLQEISHIAVRLWTSAVKACLGKELCSIINEIVRDDKDGEALRQCVVLCRAINDHCVVRGRNLKMLMQQLRENNFTLYRGTSMPNAALQFFCEVGKKFRIPMYFASSFQVSKAIFFLASSSQECPVLFTIHVDHQMGCLQACYIEGLTVVRGEDEYLFVPYSRFVVEAVENFDHPIKSNPAKVTLRACVDNKEESETVPLASWA